MNSHEQMPTPPPSHLDVLYDQELDPSFPDSHQSQPAQEDSPAKEAITTVQTVPAASELIVVEDRPSHDQTATEKSEPLRQGPAEHRRKSPQDAFLNLDRIIDLKDSFNHTLSQSLTERTFYFDKRLDKDGARAKLASDLRADLIEKYVQSIAEGNAKDLPPRIRNKVSDLMNLSYDELEKRIIVRDTLRAERESKAQESRDARDKTRSSAPKPKTQLDYYREWVGEGDVDPQTEADYAKYLQSRPHFDSDGNMIAPNGNTVKFGGITVTREESDEYFKGKKYWDYQTSNNSQNYEAMDMTNVAKALGRAEFDHDKTKVDDLTDLLIDKIDGFSNRQKLGLHSAGLSPENQGALLDRLLRVRDNYKNSLASKGQADTEKKTASFPQSEQAAKEGLASDARYKVEPAHETDSDTSVIAKSVSVLPEPIVESKVSDVEDTAQSPADEELPESINSEERSKKIAKFLRASHRAIKKLTQTALKIE
jgi:hypothetical protein